VNDQVRRGDVFRYESCDIDAAAGLVACRYSLDGRNFEERITLSPAGDWESPAVGAAARLLFLLAGVSYYKTAAPPVIDLGHTAITAAERDFLYEFYRQGLAEFAYRNGIDLTGLRIQGPSLPARAPAPTTEAPATRAPATKAPATRAPATKAPATRAPVTRALVPFGGGIDSIVTVELVRPRADAALFVVSRPGDRFAAIERPAAVAGLPVVRAGREIDPALLRSNELGFLNGHVPVTGIISAIAVLAAALEHRDAVVMSNEWSSSVPTLELGGQAINHQYSKSDSFEAGFREVLSGSGVAMPDYFSLLRPRTELWVAERFADLKQYHGTFRSCNRAFHIDKTRRLDHWCGQCDKCCFIDLILAPFMSAAELEQVFAGGDLPPSPGSREPLADPAQADRFRTLLGTSANGKPFECVGEVNECRAAALLAARRDDRADSKLLQELAAEVAVLPDAPSAAVTAQLLRPVGEDFIPAPFATEDPLT
jgi:UDP-N-acetyl-alpha-D-muramoyl-L-alanyl-L-glutamate epimerase